MAYIDRWHFLFEAISESFLESAEMVAKDNGQHWYHQCSSTCHKDYWSKRHESRVY